ncbi:MAG: serine/threonine protein kinase, partial [Myxococcota bacterium]
MVDAANEAKLTDLSNRIGNYDLIQELGRGPHGPVHLAVDTIRDRMVAIKRMQSLAGLGAEHRADLEDAFRRIAEMEAPNAGNAYAISPAAESVPYVVRAHINGLTLTQLRTHLRSMGDTFAVGLLYELARSLAAYHRRTRAHGNLKPNNVFLLKSGEVRLVDAAFAGPLLVAHCKPTEGVLGDPRFAPAEQLTHGHCMPAGDLHAMRALAGFLDDANPNEASAAGVAITTTATSAEAIVESLAAWLTERRTSAKDVLFEAAQLVGYAFLMA